MPGNYTHVSPRQRKGQKNTKCKGDDNGTKCETRAAFGYPVQATKNWHYSFCDRHKANYGKWGTMQYKAKQYTIQYITPPL